jgi:hypothetical protein
MQRFFNNIQREHIEQSKQNGWPTFPRKAFAYFKGTIGPL